MKREVADATDVVASAGTPEAQIQPCALWPRCANEPLCLAPLTVEVIKVQRWPGLQFPSRDWWFVMLLPGPPALPFRVHLRQGGSTGMESELTWDFGCRTAVGYGITEMDMCIGIWKQ